jgi:hypothetical protein
VTPCPCPKKLYEFTTFHTSRSSRGNRDSKIDNKVLDATDKSPKTSIAANPDSVDVKLNHRGPREPTKRGPIDLVLSPEQAQGLHDSFNSEIIVAAVDIYRPDDSFHSPRHEFVRDELALRRVSLDVFIESVMEAPATEVGITRPFGEHVIDRFLGPVSTTLTIIGWSNGLGTS